MPKVTVSERLTATPDEVWARICDIESYPDFMDSVIRTKVLSHHEHDDGIVEAVTEWEVLLKGSVLKWSEREHRDAANRRLTYEQVAGDLERFEGYWQVTPLADGLTEATLEVDFEIGIAMLRPMLEPVAIRAIQRNSSDMLLSLGKRAA
ncbi:hypothetical protein A6A06_01735 [Streptomyces sp. CB02923]|uniref:type II toxin-antitoxin system RatA family toxin n=1 Tax=Streptomyces sp. CB02923 TaxID=1718985 RepID=UPI00093B8A09|nr:SRPBCC family protein [Streptomyces sp. CB02923]OKI09450.1 hypothetical protein A6A06_01735 [Streptomyces sp. CB02923]